MPKFQRIEYALLFGNIKHNFDISLALNEFHKSPFSYMISKWSDSNRALCSALKAEKYEIEAAAAVKKFEAKMLHLAQYYAHNYFYRLTPEQQNLASKSGHGTNGIDDEDSAFEIFADTKRVADTLQKEHIDINQEQVIAQVEKMAQRFRDKACAEDDARNEYERNYAPYKKHECLYASVFLEYVKSAQQHYAQNPSLFDESPRKAW